jgi:hypothetical protein
MVMSEVFWTGLYSSLIGFVLAMGSQCYKSKCEKVSLCCMTIQRNIQAEEDIDIQQRPQNPITTQSLDRPNERL